MIFLSLNISINMVLVIRNPTFLEWCWRVRVMVFNAILNNISAISWRSVFISGGNQRTRRKQSTCHKTLTNFITYYWIEYTSPWTGFELIPWSYCIWIYNYLWNQCLSSLKAWVRIPLMACCTLYTTLRDKVCQWFTAGRWFSPGTPVSSTNKNWPPRYSWNIAGGSVRHHNPNHFRLRKPEYQY
jgi:hypothetical protein